MFKCFRIDGKIINIEIGTNRATHHKKHLFRLFEIKLDSIEPASGIEVFTIDALDTGDVTSVQEKLWETNTIPGVSLLLDCIAQKFGHNKIHRYLPDEHHWPERSMKVSTSLNEDCTFNWRTDKPRPIQLLPRPEPVIVTAPIPDYPPMLFRYKEKIFKIVKADGPERIEQEWWLQNGEHRDYYAVEAEDGCRYWLFRLGHYTGDKRQQWFLHGFFV
jgi:protein ImuB